MARTLHIVSQQEFGPVLLGPALRQLDLARGGLRAGVPTVLVGRSCSRALPEGIRFQPLESFDPARLEAGDALVVSAYLSGRWLRRLVASSIPFHVDLYCVTATEVLPNLDALPARRAWLERWRRVLRYAGVCSRAETVYVSNPLQTALLAGMFLALPGRTAQRLAFELPAKTRLAPMSIRETPWRDGAADPYPEALRGTPIFLWGGGIWKWFDIDTLLAAFAILAERGSPARLFFLAGRNTSNHRDQDLPHREALEKARALGLLDRNVHFNDRPVGPEDLPAYLEHCHAGILANQPHLESAASWRTRQLDLLWAGRPAVVAGEDPLSRLMADHGAAWIAPHRDPAALADLVEASLDPRRRDDAREASRALGASLGRSGVDRLVQCALESPDGFRDPGTRPDPTWVWRYVLGV